MQISFQEGQVQVVPRQQLEATEEHFEEGVQVTRKGIEHITDSRIFCFEIIIYNIIISMIILTA